MKIALLIVVVVVIGLSSGAVQQQQRFPAYQPQVPSTGPNANGGIKSALPPAGPPSSGVSPVAEARESVHGDASMLQPQVSGVNPSTPPQNYYVYYYPNQGAEQGTPTAAATGMVSQPYSSSILRWEGWNDVVPGVLSLALVLVGGYILYSKYGKEVRARALRELRDISAEDVNRMARRVMDALQNFSNLNDHTQ